jgi:hypothetical protein
MAAPEKLAGQAAPSVGSMARAPASGRQEAARGIPILRMVHTGRQGRRGCGAAYGIELELEDGRALLPRQAASGFLRGDGRLALHRLAPTEEDRPAGAGDDAGSRCEPARDLVVFGDCCPDERLGVAMSMLR